MQPGKIRVEIQLGELWTVDSLQTVVCQLSTIIRSFK
jgi:hypothetical protein